MWPTPPTNPGGGAVKINGNRDMNSWVPTSGSQGSDAVFLPFFWGNVNPRLINPIGCLFEGVTISLANYYCLGEPPQLIRGWHYPRSAHQKKVIETLRDPCLTQHQQNVSPVWGNTMADVIWCSKNYLQLWFSDEKYINSYPRKLHVSKFAFWILNIAMKMARNHINRTYIFKRNTDFLTSKIPNG